MITSILVTLVLASDPGKSRAREALEAAGWTEIRDERSSLIGCGRDDSVLTSRKFTARSPAGRVEDVRVCCGLVFGCVVKVGGL